MALKSLFSTFLLAVLAAGCSRSAPPEAALEGPEALSVTRWTEKTELFADTRLSLSGRRHGLPFT